MKRQLITEKQLPDGSLQYIFRKRGSKIGFLFVSSILLILFIVSMIVVILIDRTLFIVPLVIIGVFCSYICADQSNFVITLSKREFVLERTIGDKTSLLYRVPINEIEAFVFEPAIGVRSAGRGLIMNFKVSPYSFSFYDALKYSVGLRDIRKKTYVVNMLYGNNDERRLLKDNLNRKLSELREN